MGSPISPIVANLYMEDFEIKAINSSPQPPYLWKRFVDDTLTIIKSTQKTSFLEHPSNLPVKNPGKTAPCPSWTF